DAQGPLIRPSEVAVTEDGKLFIAGQLLTPPPGITFKLDKNMVDAGEVLPDDSSVIYINPDKIAKFSPQYQLWAPYHERAHIELGHNKSTNPLLKSFEGRRNIEGEADLKAIEDMYRDGYKLTNADIDSIA